MPSFRDRLMMLSMDEKNRLATDLFKDAASICFNKEIAMAYGYLMGQEDAKKQASSEPSIAEQAVTVIDQCCDGEYDSEYTAQLIFGLVYKWLDKMYAEQDYDPHDYDDCGTRWSLANAFQPFVAKGVINPPLPEKPGGNYRCL